MGIALNISKAGNGFYMMINETPFYCTIEQLVSLVTGEKAYCYLNKIK